MYLWQCVWFVQLKWLLMSIKYACHLPLWFKLKFLSFATPYTVFPVGWQLGYQLKHRFESQTEHSEQTSSFAYLVLSLSFRILIKYCKKMRITKSVTVEQSQTTIYAYQERFAQWIALFTINFWTAGARCMDTSNTMLRDAFNFHLLPIHVLSSLLTNMIIHTSTTQTEPTSTLYHLWCDQFWRS